MISEQSKNYSNILNFLKYKKFKLFHKNNLEKFFELIKYGIIPRPHYALGLILAAHQAKELGYKKISAIEFGCWDCDGLIDLENYINDIKNFIDIDICVYGFDLGDGHPDYNNDSRDRHYELSKGDYPFKKKDNLKKLKISKLILGDVKDTIINFTKNENIAECPIAFISLDLGLYTSTSNALKLLNEDSKFFLPRTIIYSDNNYFVLDNEGDRLAISDFNLNSKKHISQINELAEQLSMSWPKWIFLGKRMLCLSDLSHPKYNQHFEQQINILINKKINKTII